MKIVTRGFYVSTNRTVFLDVDDVTINSSEAMVAILNRKYGQNKSPSDLRDWYFKSLFPQVNSEEIEGIFDSEEFWNTVTMKKEFVSRITGEKKSSAFKSFNWIYVTKGNDENLRKKYDFLQKQSRGTDKENFFGFYGLNLHEDKSTVHMAGGIQVDDSMENLEKTDADIKILVTNGRETDYNRPVTNMENLYVVDNLDQAFDILDYIAIAENDFLKDMFIDIPEKEDNVSLQELALCENF